VVHGVGDHDVVAEPFGCRGGEQAQPVGLAHPRRGGVAIAQTSLAVTEGAQQRGAVGIELDDPVVAGIGDQHRAARQQHRLGREAQRRGFRGWRLIGPGSPVQQALRVGLPDELGEEGP